MTGDKAHSVRNAERRIPRWLVRPSSRPLPSKLCRCPPHLAWSASAPPEMSSPEQPPRNMGPAPVLGIVPSGGKGESKGTGKAGSSNTYPLDIMGGRLPSSLELRHTPEEVISLQPFRDALADHHPSQDHPHPANTGWVEGVLECFL